MPRFRDGNAGLAVFAQLVAQGPDGNAQKLGRMGSVAEAVAQRLKDEMPFNIGQGSADEEPSRSVGSSDRERGWWNPEVRLR